MKPVCHCGGTHKPAVCYQNGCRQPGCRLAHKIYMSRYRAKRERAGGTITERGIDGGHLLLPVEDVAPMMADLVRMFTYRKVAAMLGMSNRTVGDIISRRNVRVHPHTASRVRAAWDDYCAPVPADDRSWPVGPLLAAMDRRWPMELRRVGLCAKPPLSPGDRRYLYRSTTLDTYRAERICADLGFLPEDVWDGWWGYEVAS